MVTIDLHTHQQKTGAFVQILNQFAQDLPLPGDDHFYSAGIHPWHIGTVDQDKCLKLLEEAAHRRNLLAIGECGLDKAIDTDFAVQEDCFRKQIGIAEKYNKPLIIHCVRSYNELIRIKLETKSTVPWIIHGFQAKLPTLFQLIRHGFYFSVGEKLLLNHLKSEIISTIPTYRLFLETDDSDRSIRNIYLLAAQILKTDEEALAERIALNFKNLFGDGKLVTKN
jgi:TatD DNase family protein